MLFKLLRLAIRPLRNDRWFQATMIAEALGFLAAFSTIPSLGLELLPIAWMLSLTGIFSATGVVIVTYHFIWKYNERTLSENEKSEIGSMIESFLPREEIENGFAPKNQLRDFVNSYELFWDWRFQQSIMEFAWATRRLEMNSGYVLIGEISAGDTVARIVHHAVLPPPFSDVKECLSNDGETIPTGKYSDLQGIFETGADAWFPNSVLLYRASDSQIRMLRFSRSQKVVFSEERFSPMLIAANSETHLPTLVSTLDEDGSHTWRWERQVTSG